MNILITYDEQAAVFVGEDTQYGIQSQGDSEEQAVEATTDAVQCFVLMATHLGLDPMLICPASGRNGGNA